MKKNVVFRSGSLRMGGLERILIEVLQNIDKEKFNISLIIGDDCGEKNIFFKDIPSDIPCHFLKTQEFMEKMDHVRRHKKELKNRFFYNYLMWQEKRMELKRTQEILNGGETPDVFIDFDNGAAKYIHRIEAEKKIAWLHNSVPKLLKKPGKIKRFGKRLAFYDTIVSICEDMKEEVENIYPHLLGKVERIYNPFNFERIVGLSLKEDALSELEKTMLRGDYCVSVSRLDTVQKDHYTLLRAMEILKREGRAEKLYIVGGGEARAEIEGWIKELDLEDTVYLLGQTKNPYIWMKNSKFFVHSSKYEGLPTVLIEAMICGKMVVSTDCPTGPGEILQQGRCGYLSPVGDIHALADNMREVFERGEKSQKRFKNIEDRVEEFRSQNVLREYEALIERV